MRMKYSIRIRVLSLCPFLFVLMFWGCEKGPIQSEESRFFVGGPENPAPDGTYTSRIYSENGIASLEEITLGGDKQWILIRGYDISKPVLIFLHGGPGSGCIFYTAYAMGGLEQDFVVVTWDQRGSGKSYHEGIDPNVLTMDRLLSDTYELIGKMQDRFGVDRVFLMGLSWGSVLGSRIARDHPEFLHAYIGVGQVVEPARGLEIAYRAVLDRACELDHASAVAEMTMIHPDSTWEDGDIIMKWAEVFGYGDLHDAGPVLDDLAASLTEYSEEDISDLERGKALYNLSPLVRDLTWLKNLNMKTEIPSLIVPVFFLTGVYDYKTPYQLIEEYYQCLVAPAGKSLIRFENSAHVPILEERELFHYIMLHSVMQILNSANGCGF